jgi:UDP-N-acetylmuramoyl-L-alanyl-D-glutamate--2,6-diaminopimelate ligase
MTLGDLLASVEHAAWAPAALASLDQAALARPVKAIAYDSRKVVPGAVFVAFRGQRHDGLQFVPQACARGAVAIVAETRPVASSDAAWIAVPEARAALASLAVAFYRHPSRDMTVVGITGTNGKTTTAYVLSAIFEAAGTRCGMLGTVAYRVAGEERDAARTTPEAPDVQQMLREMVDRGCGACVMEVSSHALVLNRVDGIRFRAGVFTNLTRDHLDFHGDMESYFRAKARLFEMLPSGATAAVNLDDPRAASLLAMVTAPVTYGFDARADVRPGPLAFSLSGLTFDVHTPRGLLHVRSRLVGRPNVYNMLAAIGAGIGLDLPIDAIERGLVSVEGVPGRFQVVSSSDDDITVIVDYAHTDDALKNLLEMARPLAPKRLITVFGCGGDRDRTKRPLMGAVAARLSDLVIVTSDNPRTEDPRGIIEEIKRGIAPDVARPGERNGARQPPGRQPACLDIVDRQAAIDRAISTADAGDVVLIAGKGHERYQVIGERVLPFDDVAVAREALGERRGSREGGANGT